MTAFLGGRAEVIEGDITTLDVDAIVNAANPSLLGGGGVDGAIHRAAGPELLAECRAMAGTPPGTARMTGGYRLPARHVIHAVGPVWRGGSAGEDETLASAYRASLAIASDAGLQAIAFPAISTGIYGFPLERATRIALTTVRQWLDAHDLPGRVILVSHSDRDRAVYEKVAADVLRPDA